MCRHINTNICTSIHLYTDINTLSILYFVIYVTNMYIIRTFPSCAADNSGILAGRLHCPRRHWLLNTLLPLKESGLHGVADSGMEQGKCKMSLKHFVAPKVRKFFLETRQKDLGAKLTEFLMAKAATAQAVKAVTTALGRSPQSKYP